MKFFRLSAIILGSSLGTAYASEQDSKQNMSAKVEQLKTALDQEVAASKKRQVKSKILADGLTEDESNWALQQSLKPISAFPALKQLLKKNRQLAQEKEHLMQQLAAIKQLAT